MTAPDLLVGTDTGDDAGVWRLDDDRALVATVDFVTPVVDDARTWGRIAATNAASDVWAMGGRPLFALNIVGWNTDELPTALLSQVLAGGSQVAMENGFAVIGGHTVDDPEPKFGLAVIGEVHPARILRNTGLRPGDALVLTKALGTGVTCTAIKLGVAEPAAVEAAVASMLRTNAEGSRAALDAGATGVTDVTGFGLLGHLRRMAEASRVDVTLDAGAVPLLPGALALVRAGVVPGGTERNLAWAAEQLDVAGVPDDMVTLLADAQTSGGLLFGCDPAAAPAAVERLQATGHPAAVVGRVTGHGSGRTVLRLRA